MSKPLVQIVADNLSAALRAANKSPTQLARDAAVAPNTCQNVLHPERRTPGLTGSASPKLDVIEKLAAAMGLEAWQLMSESFDPSNLPTRVLTRREAELHRRIEEAYRGLDKGASDGPSR